MTHALLFQEILVYEVAALVHNWPFPLLLKTDERTFRFYGPSSRGEMLNPHLFGADGQILHI